MSILKETLLQFYNMLLQLYPSQFQEMYAEEMLFVFRMQIEEQRRLILWRAIRIIWHELPHLPILLVKAYWRERTKFKMNIGLKRWFIQPQGSWEETILAVLPFLLIGVIPGILNLAFPGVYPLYIAIPVLMLLFLSPVVLGVIGLIVGVPRWSYIYSGFLLIILSAIPIFLVRAFWTTKTPFIIYYLTMLMLCFLLVAIIIWIGSKISLTREFSQKLKKDSSLISLILYGSASVLVLGMYEEATYLGMVNQVISSLALALGVLGFLRAERGIMRLAALIAGAVVALLFVQFAPMDFNPPVLSIGFVVLAMICLPALVFREGISEKPYPST